MKIRMIIFFIMINFTAAKAEISMDKQNTIFKNLRCLVCQGQSIADSNSDFAQTIKIVVRDQIQNGKSEKEIYEFLIEKYGQWIVYKPPYNSINFILWFFPYLIFFLGGFFIFLFIRKSKRN